jgi:aminomethyltransferase
MFLFSNCRPFFIYGRPELIMSKLTVLNQAHRDAGGKMVDFAGWDMPLHYGSQKDEHHAVRQDAGMFDVSHMSVLDFTGSGSKPFLQRLLANDVDKLKSSGKALYSCMLNPDGGVIDDLIIYYLTDQHYRMVVNAGTTDKDIAWIQQQLTDDVNMQFREDLAMIAIQGPNARDKAMQAMSDDARAVAAELKVFVGAFSGDWFIARTGYTGEDGFEIMVPETDAARFWSALTDAGVRPCGLGARDTLRLEAGMNLYGQDMDETTSPLESGLSWTIAWEPEDRDFIGRQALKQQKADGVKNRFVGLLLEDRGVMRTHQAVITAEGTGELTSGGFSPTLNRSIGLARIPKGTSDHCEVDVRGKRLRARIVKPPFARNGQACVE